MKLLAVPILLASISLAANPQNTSQMTHEETVVRTAYAKLSFAIEQLPVVQLAEESEGIVTPPKDVASLSSDQRIANGELNVTLGDFVIGNVTDILDRKFGEFVIPAADWRLAIADVNHQYMSNGEAYQWWEPRASWQPAIPLAPEAVDMTIRNFFASEWQVKLPNSLLQTYAWYSVTVSYQGKTVGPYKALFLFGHDSNGNERVEPKDETIKKDAIAAAMYEHLFSDAFVASRLRDVPVISKWVNMKQQSLNCSEAQGVCCDLSRLRCGPAQALVQKALAAPVKGVVR